ncbi:MAG: site-specific DNA-methyltransferase [Patescibacteria group bacterium]|nr:site-specific DNA-methyltransferase [Patescibacteria group bacterium]
MDIPEAFEDDVENKIPILEEVESLHVSGSDNKPTHVLIKGDNYHALTCLNYTHKEKVDVIYIDPPYNTGNDGKNGFVYKDKRFIEKFPDGTKVDKNNPFRHSYWLSFMKKRLELARGLLADSGVLITHIDENEMQNLYLLLAEIFGEANDLGIIIWDKMNPKGDSRGVSTQHEYVLVFAKDKKKFFEKENILMRKKQNAVKILKKAKSLYKKNGKEMIPEEIKEVIKPFNFPKKEISRFKVKYDLEMIKEEFKNWIRRQDFSGGEKAYKYIDKHGDVYRGVSMAWPNKKTPPKEYFIPLVHPTTHKECPIPRRGWRYPPDSMKKLLENNEILFGEDENKQPERKYLLKENLLENTPSIFSDASSDDNLLEDLGVKFDYPKPFNVSKYLIESIHPNPNIVVDFFAGSGTTGHAVLEWNKEDDTKIQFILVTNDENGIFTDTCYPRLRKILQGCKGEVSKRKIKGYKEGLKVYETGFVGKHNILRTTDSDKIELAHKAGYLLAIAENTLNLIEEGSWYQFFEGTNKKTAIYFRENLQEFEEFKQKVIKQNIPTSVYVFSWGDEEFVDDFEGVSHVKVKTIPIPIVEIYKQIYNLVS